MNELGYFEQMKLNRIYNSAIDQCERVGKAKTKCLEAYTAIRNYLSSIDDGWYGDGAVSVRDKYNELQSELSAIYNSMVELKIMMDKDAEVVNTEWPALVAATIRNAEEIERG